ncbi:MAG: hypothetical protein K6G05_07945 [Lachnospiraceae bacterium]|nr:hypothetical protein [Lachnospiraceae bacterium]
MAHHHEVTYSTREELVALVKYMSGHNEEHSNELAELAEKLKDEPAYEEMRLAIAAFQSGNVHLAHALKLLEESEV